MSYLSLIIGLWRRLTYSPEKYARYIGVNLGTDNFISSTRHWSTEPYLIRIGSHCQITSGVVFYTHGGAQVARREDPTFDTFGKIIIEDWVYIGSHSLIMPGVTIGTGALIAAGSVVTKSVPEGEVWGGVPARKICSVKSFIEKNKRYNTRTKGLSSKEKQSILLSLPEDMFIKK